MLTSSEKTGDWRKMKSLKRQQQLEFEAIISTPIKSVRSQLAACTDTLQSINSVISVVWGYNWGCKEMRWSTVPQSSGFPPHPPNVGVDVQASCPVRALSPLCFLNKLCRRKPKGTAPHVLTSKCNWLLREKIRSHLPATKLGNDATFFVC